MSAADRIAVQDACKMSDGFSSQIFTGVMTVVMGIVTMVRLTRNVPKKLTDSTFYSSPIYCDDDTMSPSRQLQGNALSAADCVSVLKRMAELEERASAFNMKPVAMPPEKEAMLNTALSRVDALEQELMATKKVSTIWKFLRKTTSFVHTFEHIIIRKNQKEKQSGTVKALSQEILDFSLGLKLLRRNFLLILPLNNAHDICDLKTTNPTEAFC